MDTTLASPGDSTTVVSVLTVTSGSESGCCPCPLNVFSLVCVFVVLGGWNPSVGHYSSSWSTIQIELLSLSQCYMHSSLAGGGGYGDGMCHMHEVSHYVH